MVKETFRISPLRSISKTTVLPTRAANILSRTWNSRLISMASPSIVIFLIISPARSLPVAELPSVTAAKEKVDWEDVYSFYGSMQDDVKKLNHPDNIIDAVRPEGIEELWTEIVRIIRSVPSYDTCMAAMKKAGCKLTVDDIGKDRALFNSCVKYSPFMRKRLTLLRMSTMIKEAAECQ